MSRYSNTRTKRKPNGDRVYSYTLYPKIKIKNSDIFINPTYGDRLENLANQYYGDPELWWIIAWYNSYPTEANVPVGAALSIPLSLEQIIQVLGL